MWVNFNALPSRLVNIWRRRNVVTTPVESSPMWSLNCKLLASACGAVAPCLQPDRRATGGGSLRSSSSALILDRPAHR